MPNVPLVVSIITILSELHKQNLDMVVNHLLVVNGNFATSYCFNIWNIDAVFKTPDKLEYEHTYGY